MNLELVKKIADAVLYEGYMLYPYRASSVKNRQRFNWGVLTPESYSEAEHGTEKWQMQTECLIDGGENSEIDIKVCFLHLTEREIYKLDKNSGEFQAVDSMTVDGKLFQSWQEAIEREAEISGIKLEELENVPKQKIFSFPAKKATEALKNENGEIVG
jgi:hydrogenase maturation protease